MVNIKEYRPFIFTGKGDRFLPQIAKELAELLIETEESLVDCNISLDDEGWEFIAGILVEFAEDMHNDIGIWDSYENYNLELFGTPLPLTYDPEEVLEKGTIDKQRIFHLIWILYHEMYPEVLLSPHNYDIGEIAEVTANFLNERFEDVPRSSGVKQFLIQPNDYGWDIKLKLIWLGVNSYMFRLLFAGFMEEKNFKENLKSVEKGAELIDMFCCMTTTRWSGLGVIDILAGVLDITPEQKNELRGWYEPHHAYYKILSVDGVFVELINLINDQPYTMRINKKDRSLFKPGKTILGGFVKWDDGWYWLGKHTISGPLSAKEIEFFKKEFNQYPSGEVYIYDKEKLRTSRKEVKKQYNSFKKYFGDELKVFPDGKSMAENLKKFFMEYNKLKYKEDINGDAVIEENIEKNCMDIPVPEKVLEKDKPTGIYFNPEEGYEVFENFLDLINGFKKKGLDLDLNEKDAVYDFIIANDVSPGFVNKMVNDYGNESILSVFLIIDIYDYDPVEYLLRCYKGHYYRNRYPQMGMV